MEEFIHNIQSAAGKSSRLRGYIALALGILSLSLAPIFVRESNAPGIVTSFYRMFITLILLSFILPVDIRRKHKAGEAYIEKSSLRFLIFPILAGISSGIDHSMWSTALSMTSVTNAAVLNAVAPVWISLIALLFLHEKFTKKFWLGLVLVICGMVFVSGKGLDLFREGFSAGDWVALCSSFFYCGYYLFTQLGRRHFSTLAQMWISLLFCTLTISVIVAVTQTSLIGYERQTWITFLVNALVCQLAGYYFVTYALGCLPATVVSSSDELQPAISALLAIPILHEMLGKDQAIGCVAILLGVYLINKAKEE